MRKRKTRKLENCHPVEFMAGDIKKELPVYVDSLDDIKLIKFEELSPKTKKNLLILAQIYNIKWYEIKNRSRRSPR